MCKSCLVLVILVMALVPFCSSQQYINENDDLEVVKTCGNGYSDQLCEESEPYNIIIAATLNGAVTALDGETGEMLWRHQDSPLLQGTLSNAGPIDIGGTSLQLMPTLDGRLFSYAHEINLIEPLPITTESLLESTIRLGRDAVAGGKTVSTKGIDLFNGEEKFECSVDSCGKAATELPENPILLVKRITNSIRAMDTLRGVERWNLSTTELDVSLAHGISMGTLPTTKNRKILLQPPDGIVVAINLHNREKWKTDVGGHIVSVWQVVGNRIEEISLFEPSNIYTTQHEVIHREERNMQSQSSLLYMGTSDGYPFIIQSPKAKQNLKRKMNLLPELSTMTELTNPRFCSASGAANSVAYQLDDTALRVVLNNAFSLSQSRAIEEKSSNAAAPRGKLQIIAPNEDPSALKIGTENLRSTSLSKGGDYGYLVLESETRRNKFTVPSPMTFVNTFASFLNPAVLLSFCAGVFGAASLVYHQFRRPNQTMIAGKSNRESTESEEASSLQRTLTTSFSPADDELELSEKEESELSGSRFDSPVKSIVVSPMEKSNIEIRSSPQAKPKKRYAKTDIDTDEAFFDEDEKKRLARHRTISRSSLEGFTSRFANEFEVKKVIGHGGFGVVFRAQSITDMNEYAVKRIAVADNDTARNRVLREARALAMFDHPGIIRYFYAWEERPPKGFQDEKDKELFGKMKAEKLAKLHEIRRDKKESGKAQNIKSAETVSFAETFEMPPVVGNTKEIDDSLSISKPGVVGEQRTTSDSKKRLVDTCEFNNSNFFSDSEDESDTSETTSSSSFDSAEPGKVEIFSSSGGIEFFNGSCENAKDEEDEEKKAELELIEIDKQLSVHNKAMIVETENQELEVRRTNDTGDCAYLYIVMQLCAEKTLEHWIKRNKNPESRGLVVMKDWVRQLASGLNYLHKKGFIHRDLKPGNVFFSLDSKPDHQILKIGDLGLATKTDGVPKITVRQDSNSDAKHTKNVGTRSYMSPEQLGHQQYTEKVDIFALGLVSTELLIPFSTASERIHTFADFQKGVTPSILDSHSESRSFLMELTNMNPTERPSAEKVASHPFLR
uniref:PRKR-like endoplasmic reticulum kinase n=1 Tax=Caenorhabditis japonica TaxID=281687 RepID=A0A8R1I8T4_CAEJA